jgi:predicted dehydrogenase
MLKIGIIGCGKITQVRHAPEYQENPHCELSAYFDGIPERAKAMADQYGGKAYDSVDALLNSGVDAVSVCVANVDHASVTIKALDAGKHVLCEKPMAVTLEDCEAMVAAANRNGKFLMIGHNQRFALAHQKARALILAGEIGRPLSFHTTFGHPGPEGWTGLANSWFFDKKQAAFGALADLGVHKADIIHFLLGEPVVEVISAIGTLDKKFPDGSPISVEDNALCLMKTQSGVLGQLHVSWTFYGQEDNSTRIYGTEGTLRLYDDPVYSLILEKRSGEIQRFELDQMASNKDQTSGGRKNTGVINAFVDSLLKKQTPPVDGAEAVKAMRVIFAADMSAREHRTIYIDHTKEKGGLSA